MAIQLTKKDKQTIKQFSNDICKKFEKLQNVETEEEVREIMENVLDWLEDNEKEFNKVFKRIA